jgi:hypothetical protein
MEKNEAQPSATQVDPLEISIFPLKNLSSVKLTKLQEMKIGQKLVKNLQDILDFPDDVLRNQNKYWLFMNDIECVDQRNRIKKTLESYYFCPTTWISNHEIEIIINPDFRMSKKRDNKT